MRHCNLLCAPWSAVAAGLVAASPAAAQTFEDVGIRAQGMGGAFVAVADDATATWWNPAGLATGAYFSVRRSSAWSAGQPADPPPQGPAGGTTTGSFAIAFPALGLSYYRLRISEIAPGLYSERPRGPTRSGRPAACAFAGGESVRRHGRSVDRRPPGPRLDAEARASRRCQRRRAGRRRLLDARRRLRCVARHARGFRPGCHGATSVIFASASACRNVTEPDFGDDAAIRSRWSGRRALELRTVSGTERLRPGGHHGCGRGPDDDEDRGRRRAPHGGGRGRRGCSTAVSACAAAYREHDRRPATGRQRRPQRSCRSRHFIVDASATAGRDESRDRVECWRSA